MTFEITVGSADDVQRMARWAADEGWNPGNTDTHAFFAADPGAFRIGRLDGEPVACISVVKYGQALGFLGFYIARPQARGKGFGIQVWRAGMARLEGRNIGLDGVVAQQANYRKSGFRVAVRDGELAGFAVMRACQAASRVGPLFAASPEIAASLVSGLAAKTGATAVAIDMPDINKPAIALAERIGLKPSFETARMYTGPDPKVDYAGLFGVTSLELG